MEIKMVTEIVFVNMWEISGSVFLSPFFKNVGIQCLPSIVLILLVFHVSTVSSLVDVDIIVPCLVLLVFWFMIKCGIACRIEQVTVANCVEHQCM